MDRLVAHKDLIVWQKAIALACKVYAASRLLPSDERFGLQSELRRAALSIPSSIAEGSARQSRADFIRFLHNARGSLAMLETQYAIASRVTVFDDAVATQAAMAEVGRLLNSLIGRLVTSSRSAHAKACAPLR
jgi:four helix bundle protein